MAAITGLTTFSPNTLILSSEANSNNSNIATTYNAHDVATTAVHGITGTIVGTSETQTLTNKTLTSPTINTPTLTGPVVTSGHLKLNETQRVVLDADEDNDTFLYVPSPATDAIYFTAGGTASLRVSNASVFLENGIDLVVQNTQKLRLDGNTGGDTYLTETSANNVDLYVGGSQVLNITAAVTKVQTGNFSIEPTTKLLLDGNGDTYFIESGANVVDLYCGATHITRTFSGGFKPGTDNTFDLGNGSDRWAEVFAAIGTINTSDEREKENIQDLTVGLAEVMKMRPVLFNWKEGKNTKTNHFGFIAQEVQKVITMEGNGVIDYDENADRYGMRYHELIPILVNAVQELSKKVSLLEERAS